MSTKEKQSKEKDGKDELPAPWDKIQGAIWLIGLAILAYAVFRAST